MGVMLARASPAFNAARANRGLEIEMSIGQKSVEAADGLAISQPQYNLHRVSDDPLLRLCDVVTDLNDEYILTV